MSEPDVPGFGARTAAEAARGVALRDEARALLGADTTPDRYLDELAGRGLLPDAVQFLAHALGRRDGVRWACLCVRESLAGAAPEPAESALRAAERWAAEPDEPNRRAAETAAGAAGAASPAGLAALAAFWSEGSLAPATLPEVAPPAHLAPRGIAGAVLLAAVAGDPETAPDRFRRFLALGREVAARAAGPVDAPPPPALQTAPTPPPARPAARPSAVRRRDTWE